ncbi:MAG: thiolase [Dehalococcoidia bacterium]|nr:thiolase [Dehalococcoidia bacterium]
MPSNPSRAAAIVAAAESNEIGYLETPKTDMMLAIEALQNVCREAGIGVHDIEAVFATTNANEIAEYTGMDPRWIDTTSIGGCSYEVHVAHALAGINAGMFDIAVVLNGQAGYSRRNFPRGGTSGPTRSMERVRGNADPQSPDTMYLMPYGVGGAPTLYSHAMTRHMYEFGSTKEDFAQVAVTTRDWAMLNPRAVMYSKETHPNGGEITVQDVLDSPLIAWPLNLLDCCLVTDHGGAVILASERVVHRFRGKPVWIDGAGEAMQHTSMLEIPDFTTTSAKKSGARAYAMAGMGPQDMELALMYDSFTVTAAITAEMLGLTRRGEGTSLWDDGKAGPGGSGIPVNTNGGGLSFNHSGRYGMMLLIEAYRQLAGIAEDGVHGVKGKQTAARSAVVNGAGGTLSATGTLVLTAD